MTEQNFTRTCLRLFAAILGSNEFKEEVHLSESKTLDMLRWIHDCEVPEAIELKDLLTKKNKERVLVEPVQSLFKDGPPALREIGRNHMRQIFKVALSFNIYARKDARVGELFDAYVLTGSLRPSMFVGSNYIPSKTDVRAPNRVETDYFGTKAPKTFEVILVIHAMNACQYLYSRKGRKKGKESTIQIRAHYQTSNRMGFAVQLLFNAWTALAKAIGLHDFQEMVSPYIVFKRESGTFTVLSKREEGFARRSQRESLLNNSQPSQERDHVDTRAFDRSTEADHAFRTVSAKFFSDLQTLITHCHLYDSEQKVKNWPLIDVYRLKRENIPEVFSSLPKEVLAGIGYRGERKKGNGIERSVRPEVIDVDVATEQADTEANMGSCVIPISKRKRNFTENQRQVMKSGRDHIAPEGSARFIKMEEQLVVDIVNKRLKNCPNFSSMREAEEEYEGLFHALFDFMSSKYCRIHDVPFSALVDVDADESGFYLDGKVSFVVTDPPYNIRNQRSANNSSHDVLTESDMKKCVELFDALLKKGGHGLIFCSSLQFHTWFELLKEYTVCQEDGDSDEDSQPLRRMKISPFHVEEAMIHFQSSPGHYNRDPAKKSLAHMSVVQTAIHFWKKGTSEGDCDRILNYQCQGYVSSRHAAWTNCIDNIPRLGPEEGLYFPKGVYESQGMVRPEQKSILLLMEIISQYTNEGDIVVDMFGGTFSAAKACLNLPKYRQFVGCDSDETCVKLAIPHVLVAFAKQLCNDESNITGTEQFQQIARAFLNHPKFAAAEAKKHASLWSPPSGLPIYQRLPEHVHRYLASGTMDGSICFQYRHVPPDKWPNKFRAYLNIADVGALLNTEAAAKGLVVCKSSIRHRFARAGVFAARVFKKGEQVLTYYGTLVYRDLCKESASTKEYGSGVLAVRKKKFTRTAVELLSETVDDKGKTHQVFIVPAPFCVGSLINDPRYLPGDEDWAEMGTLNERKANVVFTQTESRPTKKLLRSNKLLVIEACRDISVGEELFVYYGSGYTSWGAMGN